MKGVKVLFLTLIISLLLLLSIDNSIMLADTGAKIRCEEESYDFGEIKQGDKVSHTFTFTNTGDEVLVLKSVRGS
ncbi:MAG: DUF1573 domain-containing protein [Nitrospinae bacterium]|nr:DUF1573 domain-containing protein [Nitrospinota bacterium]